MSDLPILFSAPMVRAILDGRKSQTRRILNPEPQHLQVYDWKGKRLHDSEYRHWCWKGHVGDDNWGSITDQLSPFLRVKVGDRLYVREHWRTSGSVDTTPPRDLPRSAAIVFEADGFPAPRWRGKHRQAMHMPKWASRITLIVEGVKIERLNDCSEADAIAEGIGTKRICGAGETWVHYGNPDAPVGWQDPRQSYASLWDSINGAGAWDANPWVVAYTFRSIFQNIDQIARAA